MDNAKLKTALHSLLGLGVYVTTAAVLTLKAHPQLTGDISFTPPEGSLLPNTYNIKKGETREDLLVRMARAMSDTLDEAWENRAPNLPITTKREALILASIIEKETGKADERRAVAGVFINRLRKSMPLQTDPTVIYAITKGAHKNEGKGPLGRRLLRKDLKFPSPYNTYLNAGLTPGPIANPGKASIEAALNPEAHEYIILLLMGRADISLPKPSKSITQRPPIGAKSAMRSKHYGLPQRHYS